MGPERIACARGPRRQPRRTAGARRWRCADSRASGRHAEHSNAGGCCSRACGCHRFGTCCRPRGATAGPGRAPHSSRGRSAARSGLAGRQPRAYSAVDAVACTPQVPHRRDAGESQADFLRDWVLRTLAMCVQRRALPTIGSLTPRCGPAQAAALSPAAQAPATGPKALTGLWRRLRRVLTHAARRRSQETSATLHLLPSAKRRFSCRVHART